jgi:hypothetical protein
VVLLSGPFPGVCACGASGFFEDDDNIKLVSRRMRTPRPHDRTT